MRPSSSVLALITMAALTSRAEGVILEDKGHRVRGGFSVEVGSAVVYGGLAAHAELRLGYQLSRRFSLFTVVGAGLSVIWVYGGQFDLGAVAEWTLDDHFSAGAGLAASYGSTGVMTPPRDSSFSSSASPFIQDASAGFRPTLDLRLGFSTGSSRPPTFSRGGFSVGAHALLVLHPNMTQTNPDGRTTTPLPVQVIFTPMFTVGFDFR